MYVCPVSTEVELALRTPRFIVSLKEQNLVDDAELKELARYRALPPLLHAKKTALIKLLVGQEVSVSISESHHLRNVLRLKTGDPIELFDPEVGVTLACKVQPVKIGKAQAVIVDVKIREVVFRTNLIVGAPKPETCDTIVEKAVELGVSSVSFFRAGRTQGSGQVSARLERLQRVAKTAIKQSFADSLPEITFDPSLIDLLRRLHPAKKTGNPGARPPQATGQVKDTDRLPWKLLFSPPDIDAIQDFRSPAPSLVSELLTEELSFVSAAAKAPPSQLENISQTVDSYVMIGPEGGFERAEIELAAAYGYRRTSLGPSILRVETAAVAACSIVTLYQRMATKR